MMRQPPKDVRIGVRKTKVVIWILLNTQSKKMNTQAKIIVIVFIFFSIIVFWYIKNVPNSLVQTIESGDVVKEFEFENKDLKTNTAKKLISLEKVLDGGPGKDGIPALTNPKFTSVEDAEKDIAEDIYGMVVSVGDTTKFYPFSVMVWHEIVNDIFGNKPLVITFCPLCGSAIVFDTQDQFGVSGKLYESNLLMYDKNTESLWSQSVGTAVVGDRTGEKLAIYNSQLMTFQDFKKKWPNGQVLSTDTGYRRDYNFYPYRDYNDNEEIFFPVSIQDNRLPIKEIMYVVNAYEHSVAFPVKQLSSSVVSVAVGDNKVFASIVNGEVIVKDSSGKILQGYNEMWFSWATQHQKDGIVWIK